MIKSHHHDPGFSYAALLSEVKHLLAAKADSSQVDSEKQTALHWAVGSAQLGYCDVTCGDMSMVRLYLKVIGS